MNPYSTSGPTAIAFSGGATSGYMLHEIAEAHGGRLPDDTIVLFQNTGREMEATLRFVRDCERGFGVPIVWLEYASTPEGPSFRVVNFDTASRNGEPFAEMLGTKKTLPNPVARFCTIELKIRTAKRYIMATRGWKRWTNIVGLRADEPKRVARATNPEANKKDRWDVRCPLAEAGITRDDVDRFWAEQEFRLELNGRWEGNCDGCFLKGKHAIMRMMSDYPERMAWWAEQEAVRRSLAAINPTVSMFRKDRPNYAAMLAKAGTLRVSRDLAEFDTLMNADPECGNSCEPLFDVDAEMREILGE